MREGWRRAARLARSVHARERPQEKRATLSGAAKRRCSVQTPPPSVFWVVSATPRGGLAFGAPGHGSIAPIAPVPSSPARVLGDHPRRMLHWSKPKRADGRR